jgi:hypothetical protein
MSLAGQSDAPTNFWKKRCVLPCYKSEMKTTERWVLFKYVGTDLTPLSKPFKTKELAEKARLKFSERERRAIGLGVIRTTGS